MLSSSLERPPARAAVHIARASMQLQVLLLANFPRRCNRCRLKYFLARFLPQERVASAFQRGYDVGITQPAGNVQHIIYLPHTFADFAHGYCLCVCQVRAHAANGAT